MTIHKILSSQIRTNGVRRFDDAEGGKAREKAESASSPARSDTLEISQEGRVLSAKAHDAMEEADGLSQSVLDEIQKRIEDGTYDSPEVAEEVARQVLNSGDLEL